MVIEPRKRHSKKTKEDKYSKFGTYLRYIKVTNYDNSSSIEKKIIYFMKNYEINESTFIVDIAKIFNVTEDRAAEEIQKVKYRYPNIRKARKVLKKMEEVPKHKTQGIGIDIQGKQKDKYKIRIAGARTEIQMNRILELLNVLIYLYIETYLYKKKDKQILKEKLKLLTNIAKRRSKVEEIVDYSKDVKTIKQITNVDKQRLGFTPEKGQNQWSRACQNSGTDGKRQPLQYTNSNINNLLKKGYTYNSKLDVYEKKIKKNGIVLRTVKVPEIDDTGENTGNYIHYACTPEDNGSNMYIGFLTKSKNPSGYCMPCCFKKDFSQSNNLVKKKFFENCVNDNNKKMEKTQLIDTKKNMVNEKLYILQDTNKIQDGRYGYLPKYMDRYFNFMLNKTLLIKNNYLEYTQGYYFKYGTPQNNYPFLNCIAAAIDTTVEDIKIRIIDMLSNDKNDQIFTSLNKGDIKTQFGTIDKYIDFIKTAKTLDYHLIKDIISIPSVLMKGGINIILFKKHTVSIKKTLEKDVLFDDFYIECGNLEDLEQDDNVLDKTFIIVLKDESNYYLISYVQKKDKDIKTLIVDKTFYYENDGNSIVSHIYDFYNKTCSNAETEFTLSKYQRINANNVFNILGKKQIMRQIIDERNKCIYLVLQNGYIIPVKPSGSIWNIIITKDISKYIKSFDETFKYLNELYISSDKLIPVKPIGVYYSSKHNGVLKVNSIMIATKDFVPIFSISKPI